MLPSRVMRRGSGALAQSACGNESRHRRPHHQAGRLWHSPRRWLDAAIQGVIPRRVVTKGRTWDIGRKRYFTRIDYRQAIAKTGVHKIRVGEVVVEKSKLALASGNRPLIGSDQHLKRDAESILARRKLHFVRDNNFTHRRCVDVNVAVGHHAKRLSVSMDATVRSEGYVSTRQI